jgi:hypothetical protein
VVTKSTAHALVLHHYRRLTIIEFIAIGIFLAFLGIYRSNLLALSAGLFLGTLLGNGGELIVHGYATDWIQFRLSENGRLWLTNLADISAALGLICLFVDFSLAWKNRQKKRTQPTRHYLNTTTVTSALAAVLIGVLTHDLDLALIVFLCVVLEVNIIQWLRRRQVAIGS